MSPEVGVGVGVGGGVTNPESGDGELAETGVSVGVAIGSRDTGVSLRSDQVSK